MRVGPSTILLKGPVANKNFIPMFQCNGKCFFDINSMIDCSFIQDFQRYYTQGTSTHYFRWKFSSLLSATVFIDISTTYCSHPIILRVIDTIDVKELLIRKEDSHDVCLSKICSKPVCQFFRV